MGVPYVTNITQNHGLYKCSIDFLPSNPVYFTGLRYNPRLIS